MSGKGDRDVPILIDSLCQPGILESGSDTELVQTHISWVLLTGSYAFKIKKPVNLGFVDFSTVEKREFFCREELRLNRRLARSLYLGVVSISGSADMPVIDGGEPAIEWAVKMVRFSQSKELRRLVSKELIALPIIRTLGSDLAAFHESAAVADTGSDYATQPALQKRAMDNFDQIRQRIGDAETLKRLEILRNWTLSSLELNAALFASRKRRGRVRECHGDLHLGNLVMLDGRIVPFDCLEFNAEFRWIDVASEIAFLLMDFNASGFEIYARVLLNGYLEDTGDFQLLALLRHFTVYRAMVRAKVTCLRDEQIDRSCLKDPDFLRYLELAERAEKQPYRGRIIITHGFSGCGKTWLSRRIVEKSDAIHLRSDIVRRQLNGFDDAIPFASAVGGGLYTESARDRTYLMLATHTREVVNAGYPALVDATFLGKKQRMLFSNLAEECGVPFSIVDIDVSRALLEARISARLEAGNDASEANLDVLENQIASHDPLNDSEQRAVVLVDGDNEMEPQISALIEELGIGMD